MTLAIIEYVAWAVAVLGLIAWLIALPKSRKAPPPEASGWWMDEGE